MLSFRKAKKVYSSIYEPASIFKVILWFFLSFILIQEVIADDETLFDAIALYESRQFDLAKQQFSNALHKPHTQNEALLYLGRIAYDQGEPKAASSYLLKAIDLEPNVSDEYYWLARTYADQARSMGAVRGIILARKIKKYSELAIDRNPESVHSLRLLIDFHLFAPSFIGGSTDAAKENIDKLFKISLIDAYIKQLELFNRLKNTKEALAAASGLILNHPESAEALHLAGFTLQANSLLNEAQQCFEQALSLTVTPDNIYYIDKVKYRYAETALWNNTKTEEAISVLSDLLKTNKNNNKFNRSWSIWTLAKLYLYAGDINQYVSFRDSLTKNDIKKDKILRKDVVKYNKKYEQAKGNTMHGIIL